MNFAIEAESISEEIVQTRRLLHRTPEVGLRLPKTQEFVKSALDDLGIEYTVGTNCDSVTGLIRGKNPSGHAVLLRADMDALPIREHADVDFAADNGAMHGCGHDLHMAMLLGAARLLKDVEHELAGTVVLMFQPGEEGHDGALRMIEEGILDAAGTKLAAAYALHVFSSKFESDFIGVRPGPVMSASDSLSVTVIGQGGHGSAPHQAADPIAAAAAMISGLQTMVTRRFDIFDPVVLTCTSIAGGQPGSIIPDNVEFTATVRSFSTASQERLQSESEQVLAGIAAAHGVQVQIDYQQLYPVTVNDPVEASRVLRLGRALYGDNGVRELAAPMAASEDFAHILSRVPGAFVILGATPDGKSAEDAPFNHSAEAVFNEKILPRGAALLASLAMDRLAESRA
ncbi:amidohydrolase (plasmid) [Rhodococcus erythropolis R138]|uniref:M20 metallopeptidase family protein n=1 Tax=Rhodococcus erythropolis TaxID=1833 RepID=UPI0004927069|nr:M20 family metallopeptidase [Rhodococcus erythropolis]ALU73418.1 amidohydrolase [Rhodococcus erythropolis R138]